jgi:hypothetical protein
MGRDKNKNGLQQCIKKIVGSIVKSRIVARFNFSVL